MRSRLAPDLAPCGCAPRAHRSPLRPGPSVPNGTLRMNALEHCVPAGGARPGDSVSADSARSASARLGMRSAGFFLAFAIGPIAVTLSRLDVKICPCFLATALSSLLIGGALAQAPHGHHRVNPSYKAVGPPPPIKSDDAGMMQAMIGFAETNAHHQSLKIFVGSWEVTSRLWTSPSDKPVETWGSAEKRMVLGERPCWSPRERWTPWADR